MDNQDIQKMVYNLLAEGKDSEVARWMRQSELSYAEALTYVIKAVRQWSLEQEQKQPAPGLTQFSPELGQRLKEGQATPLDWAEILPRGIYLERQALFLPWGAPLTSVEKTGASPVFKDDPGLLALPYNTILGGLALELTAGVLLSFRGFRFLSGRPYDYQVYGEIEWDLEPEWLHLKKVLGEPTGRPTEEDVMWRFGRTEVTLHYYTPHNDFHSDASYHKSIHIHWQGEE